jgi:hypothetical protein
MGHAIRYIEVEEKANRKSVMADIQEHARENGDGYSSKMTWHDDISPLQSRDEAKTFIEAHDNGFYDDHAVRFFDYSGATKTAKIKEYETKIAELMKSQQKYIAEHSVRKFQAKHIGCPKCSSKINKDYLRTERCPLCGTDLRSKTTLDKIAWFGTKIEELHNRIDTEKMKQKNKAKIKWLVKYEYHC